VLSTLIVELESSPPPLPSPSLLKEEVGELKEECEESSLSLSSPSSPPSLLSSSLSNRAPLLKKKFNVKLLSLLLRAFLVF
jgi:hypothetical protein